VVISEFTIAGQGAPLSAKLYTEGATHSCVIFSHGLFSGKDGYKIVKLAPDIVKSGYALLTFDFSSSGSNISSISIEGETNDLSSVVDYALTGGFKEIHLMGSSMGAAVSLLYNRRVGKYSSNIKSLILLAVPFDLPDLVMRGSCINDINLLPKDGFTPIEGIPINNRFFKEAVSLNPRALIKVIDLPVLVIHGTDDLVVPPFNADLIREISDKAEIIMIEGGGHDLTRDSDLDLIREAVVNWLRGFHG
jgi:pimeloyl-ACP methyl ester carboxylesterase